MYYLLFLHTTTLPNRETLRDLGDSPKIVGSPRIIGGTLHESDPLNSGHTKTEISGKTAVNRILGMVQEVGGVGREASDRERRSAWP